MCGLVETYNIAKKFGFIECIGAGKKSGKLIICNRSDFVNTSYLKKDDMVDFIIVRNRARNVFLVRKET